ncbi:MAG: hypothetical protein AAGK21_14205 [Bacteroidota bacterium]
MRASILLPFLALLAACSEPEPPPQPAPSEAALLAPVTQRALDEAFARLADAGFTADVEVTEFDTSGVVLGTDRLAIESDGEAERVVRRQRDGSLDGTGDAAPQLTNPLPVAISQDPPYLDPSVQDAYQIEALGDTIIAGSAHQRVEARLADPSRQLGIVRVWAAVDGETLGAVEVDRSMASAIYGESSRIRVELGAGPGGLVPRRIVTDTESSVVLSEPRRIRVEWTIRPAAGA